jgi:hypothetical protein
MSVWDLAVQLQAYRAGRAVPKLGCVQQTVTDHAKLFCPLAMAGWDPSLQAAAIAGRHRGADMLFCADPREWDLQLDIMSQLHTRIGRWFDECYADGEGDQFPQIVLPSAATAQLLSSIAYRYAWLYIPPGGSKDYRRKAENARELGRMLLYFVQQMDIPGQQSVIVASSRLTQHFAIGQQPSGNLPTLLTWINPPEGQDVLQAALAADREPLERTSVKFDEELEQAIRDFLKTRKTNGSFSSFHRTKIDDALRDCLNPIVEVTRAALDAVDQLRLPELPAVQQLRSRELTAFRQHMKHLAADGRFSKADKPKAAVRGLTVLEDAGEQLHRAVIWGDPVMLAKARFEGDVLHGVTANLNHAARTVDVISAQNGLKVRVGDDLTLMNDPDTTLHVTRLHADGASTVVTGEVDGLICEGQTVDFGPEPPAWHMLGISLRKVFRRMASQPDTHRPGSAVPVTVPAMPDSYSADSILEQWSVS